MTFILVFILGFSMAVKRIRFSKKFYKRIIMVFFYIIFLAVLLYLFIIRQHISGFFDFTYTHNSILQRLYYWRSALRMIKDYPLIGVGFRKFGIFYYFYKLPQANITNYAHNVFLQINAELGLWGLFSFLAIVYAFLKTGTRILKRDSQDYTFKLSLLCAGSAFLVNNAVDLSFYFAQVAILWWIILGLVNNCYIQEKADKKPYLK
ncbi:MAG: O-antigen ligase family protein [Candidatus Omnitrophica bacterium]|nr:O-antigen ligase family protein [Candidatus Omnitrophota bacterium]